MWWLVLKKTHIFRRVIRRPIDVVIIDWTWISTSAAINLSLSDSPTNPFKILELPNPSHDVPELHRIRRSPDLEAPKLWKGSSGNALSPSLPAFPLPARWCPPTVDPPPWVCSAPPSPPPPPPPFPFIWFLWSFFTYGIIARKRCLRLVFSQP